jgi:hypothetical protein
MYKTIKITLITIVAAGILSAIMYFLTGISKPSGDAVIASTDFEKHIKERVDKEITNKEYDEATKGFETINGDIETEKSITTADGHSNLSGEEEAKCRKMVFYAYAPIFTQYTSSYFNNSYWNESKINQLKASALKLLNAGIAEGGTEVCNKLNATISTVNDYYGAKRVIYSASHCASSAAVESVRIRAQQFRRAPLNNNTGLMSGLNSAYSNAKSSYARHVISCCSHVAKSYTNYGSYPSFYAALNNANRMIEEYTNKYGGSGQFNSVKNQLLNADQKAMEYFSN